MKTIFKCIIFSCGIILFILLLTTCKKDKEMTAVITIRMQNDTNILVPNALVQIKKGDVLDEGLSDANGQFRHTYKLEAILDVYAEIDTGTVLSGTTIIRLKPGQTVYKSVFIY